MGKERKSQESELHVSLDEPWYTVAKGTEEEMNAINGDERDLPACEELYKKEVAIYKKKHDLKKSDQEWFQSVVKSGTLKDKVSAISIRIRSSVLHNIELLNNMMTMAKKKNRKESMIALEALKELMINCALPDRKLVYFKYQKKHKNEKERIIGYFEHWLKKYYFEVIQLLEELSKDTMSFVKYKVINLLYELLTSKPEQEQNLLTMLVNKLGDPENKIASRVSFLLSQLLVVHPNMKMIVVKEVEHWILVKRPKDDQLRYYGIIFMTQVLLTKNDKEVANYLLKVYFEVFRLVLPEKREINEQETKLIAAILTGVNRAYPFSDKNHEEIENHIDVLYLLVHNGSVATSLQALTFLSNLEMNDRFYRTFYEFLGDQRLLFCENKVAALFNLLYKALLADSHPHRVPSFIKRLLQLSPFHEPPFICASLLLISNILKEKPGLYLTIHQTKNVSDDDEEENYKDADAEKEKEEKPEKACYFYKKRDPRFSNAHLFPLVELKALTHHYHPTVKLYATTLLQTKNPLECSVDPLLTFTLANFLDRFIQKKSPPAHQPRGSSIMQATQSTLKYIDASSLKPFNPQDALFFQYIKMSDALSKRKKKVKLQSVDEDEDELINLSHDENAMDSVSELADSDEDDDEISDPDSDDISMNFSDDSESIIEGDDDDDQFSDAFDEQSLDEE